MSDSSAYAVGWADALTRVLTWRSVVAPQWARREFKHAAVFLYALGWLAMTTQPLNLFHLPLREQGSSRIAQSSRPDALPDDLNGLAQGDGPERTERQQSDLDVDRSDADRHLRAGQRAGTHIAHRMFGLSDKAVFDQIEAGLYMALMFMAAPYARRRFLVLVQEFWSFNRRPTDASSCGTAPLERRREPRVRTRFRRGVLYDGAGMVCDCVVYDRSPHGARIRTPFPLPSIQELRFVDSYERCVYEGRVAWQADTEAGLALDRMVGPISPRKGLGTARHRSATIRS